MLEVWLEVLLKIWLERKDTSQDYVIMTLQIWSIQAFIKSNKPKSYQKIIFKLSVAKTSLIELQMLCFHFFKEISIIKKSFKLKASDFFIVCKLFWLVLPSQVLIPSLVLKLISCCSTKFLLARPTLFLYSFISFE